MCQICNHSPCVPRCPNYDELNRIYYIKCIECDSAINDGDEYINSEEGFICLDCLKSMGIREVLELTGTVVEKY